VHSRQQLKWAHLWAHPRVKPWMIHLDRILSSLGSLQTSPVSAPKTSTYPRASRVSPLASYNGLEASRKSRVLMQQFSSVYDCDTIEKVPVPLYCSGENGSKESLSTHFWRATGQVESFHSSQHSSTVAPNSFSVAGTIVWIH
jgi:hypothetical protein